MAIEQKFRKFGESAIASYNFTDIAEGTGIVTLYAFGNAASGAYQYSLTGQEIRSFEIESVKTIPAAVFTFDSSVFNYPRIAKGTAMVRFSSDSYNSGGGHTIYWNIKIQKVSNGVITTLGNADSASSTVGGGHNLISWTVTIVLTQTNFKIGDQLRLLMTAGGNGDVTLGHDPADRDGSTITPSSTYPTKLEFYMPFKIDI